MLIALQIPLRRLPPQAEPLSPVTRTLTTGHRPLAPDHWNLTCLVTPSCYPQSMADTYTGKLVVAGEAAEVRRFVEAAREKPAFGRPRGRPFAPLSFQALLPLGYRSPKRLYGTSSRQPSDVWADEPTTLGEGVLHAGYNFQTQSAPPERWLVHVSKRWPFLRFVLGYVKFGTGAARSIYVRAGQAARYTVSSRRIAAAYAAHRRCWKPDPTDKVYEEVRQWAEFEVDWDVMDLAVTRWDRFLRAGAGVRSRGRRDRRR
jgi:hypothetical protein